MSFTEAMEELNVRDSVSPLGKLRAVCQWEFGDPGWAPIIIDWLEKAGYTVSAASAESEVR